MKMRLKSIYNVTNYFENTESSNGLKTPSKYEFNTSLSHLRSQILSTDHPKTAYFYHICPGINQWISLPLCDALMQHRKGQVWHPHLSRHRGNYGTVKKYANLWKQMLNDGTVTSPLAEAVLLNWYSSSPFMGLWQLRIRHGDKKPFGCYSCTCLKHGLDSFNQPRICNTTVQHQAIRDFPMTIIDCGPFSGKFLLLIDQQTFLDL
jgi:hypothetical protein